MLDEAGSGAELEVDGGINAETASKAVEAGARVLVAGSAVFNDRDTVAGVNCQNPGEPRAGLGCLV